MTVANEIDRQSLQDTLKRQRALLREQLSAQRRVYMQKMGPMPGLAVERAYPRSRIMRFLTEHPDLAKRLLGQLATLAISAPLIKSAISAITVTGLFRAAAKHAR